MLFNRGHHRQAVKRASKQPTNQPTNLPMNQQNQETTEENITNKPYTNTDALTCKLTRIHTTIFVFKGLLYAI